MMGSAPGPWSYERCGGETVTFDEVLEQALEMLRRRGRVSYRALKVQFQLDDPLLEILRDEIVEVHQLARDQEGKMLVWTGDTASPSVPASAPAPDHGRAPLTYTPPYLAEKILTSRPALAGERKQVTVLFADIKDSTELIKDLDPEAAQQLLDPALHRMMEAVHRFEGTVNQVLGDGIMALFGAPLAHEDHALRACYAALTMQTVMREYTEAVRRRLQAAAARGLTRFVGRETEIAALRQALDQAGAGHGQVVAVVGEAGVGKSRLVYEGIHAHHTQGWLVLESASVSYGKATPYFPVVDLLKRYVHVEDADEPRTVPGQGHRAGTDAGRDPA